MKTVRVGAIDPSLAATGMGKFDLALATTDVSCVDLRLVRTAPSKEKTVRVNSDDLRRCTEIAEAMDGYFNDCAAVFVELTSGAGQSFRANLSFGMNYGLLASLGLKVPLVQVQVREVKLALCGSAHADKPEIIEWALQKHPTAPFMRAKNGRLLSADINSHLADCCLIVEAGVKTPEFRRTLNLWKMAA